MHKITAHTTTYVRTPGVSVAGVTREVAATLQVLISPDQVVLEPRHSGQDGAAEPCSELSVPGPDHL